MPDTMPVITNHTAEQGLLLHTEATFFALQSVKNLYSKERDSNGCVMKMELKNDCKNN